MPRYFFDVVDGEMIADDVGTVLPDHHAMRQEGLRFAATLLSEEPIRRELGHDWALVVRDEHGASVLQLTVKTGQS